METGNRTVVTFWQDKNTAIAILVPFEGAVRLVLQHRDEIAALDSLAALLEDLAAVAEAIVLEIEKIPWRQR